MYSSALESAGLYTFPNNLSKVPVGALLQADNIVISREGVAESRRGVAKTGTTLGLSGSDFIDQYFSYQNRLLVHDSTGVLSYDSDGAQTWTAFTGTFDPPASIAKIKGAESNKNFYFSTDAGIYKMDAYNAQPTTAGAVPALDGTAALAGDGSGFLGASKQCVYQVVFGYTDANGNLILGSPSQRILAVNSTAGDDDVDVTFTVPSECFVGYFYQLYRTVQTDYSATPSLNVPPGAEPQLAAQNDLSSGDISAGTVTYTDITPDELLDTFLYTNPSQEGPTQSNDRPPMANDMCLYNQMMLYADVQSRQNTQFNLISVDAPNGIQIDDTVTVNAVVFTGKATQNNASQQFEVVTSGTVSENIDQTARNLVACMNANAATTDVYAFYLSGYNDLPGKIGLEAISLSQGVFYVLSSRGGAFNPFLPVSGTTFASSNDSTPNGLAVSKVGQPEAVPFLNLVPVGGGDQPILRVKALRGVAIVIKTDGIYTVSGATPQTLSVTLLDSTIICIAPESVTLLNNSVYCMTNQGVVSITESGVTIQSRPIESDLLEVTAPQFTYFKQATAAISYESERLYILTLPTNEQDTYGTQAYCFNWVTNAWTRWPIDISAGIVNPYDNLLYLGRPDTDRTFAYQERKTYTYNDYMDDVFPVTISSVDTTGLIITITTTPDADWVGYGFAQTDAGIAIITAVDTGSKTITVDIDDSTVPGEALPWVAGAAEIEVPIPLDLMWCPQTGSYPHVLKSWGRVNFWFNGGNFQNISTGFQTDITGPTQTLAAIVTGGYGFGPFGGGAYGGTANFPQSIQTLVPVPNSQARWIQPSLSLSFPKTRFSSLGVTMSYDIISDVSG